MLLVYYPITAIPGAKVQRTGGNRIGSCTAPGRAFFWLCLKGLSHEMDLAFDDLYGYFLALNRGQGNFLKHFLCAPMIL
jgi:hypothetical protein